MNYSRLCAISQTDIFFPFAFSHKLWSINVKKNLVSKEIDNKFPYSILSQGYDPIFFLEASLFLAFSS